MCTADAMSPASSDMCDQMVVPSISIVIAPPSWAKSPIVWLWNTLCFAMSMTPLATTRSPSSSSMVAIFAPCPIGQALRVGERGQVDPFGAAEIRGVRQRRLADQDQTSASLRNAGAVTVQLHRVCTAERSAVMAQPDEHRGLIAPEISQSREAPLVVWQPDAYELIGTPRRRRVLTSCRGAEHEVTPTAP